VIIAKTERLTQVYGKALGAKLGHDDSALVDGSFLQMHQYVFHAMALDAMYLVRCLLQITEALAL
jgi:hypothetical protein